MLNTLSMDQSGGDVAVKREDKRRILLRSLWTELIPDAVPWIN
ncbi:hypothetical protein ACFL6G_05980 [candidate division KSB1 bacterium]